MTILILTRDEADRLDADGHVVLFREGGYEVCFALCIKKVSDD